MKMGWNPELEQLVRRADPEARVIVEAAAVAAEDLRRLRSEWEAADSLIGLTLYDDGAVRLASATQIPAEYGAHSSLTLLGPAAAPPDAPPEPFVVVRWIGPDAGAELQQIVLHLVSQKDPGQPKEVAEWSLQLYSILLEDFDGTDVLVDLVPIAHPLVMPAVGTTSPGDITFDFLSLSPTLPRVGPRPRYAGTGVVTYKHPTVAMRIRPLKADGTLAANAGLGVGAGPNLGFDATLEMRTFSPSTSRPGLYVDEGGGVDVPRMLIRSTTFAAATITFSQVGPVPASNQVDLGAAPATAVELAAQGDTPAGSVITAEVLADDASWTPFRDGDLADTDNTPRGGANLSASGPHRVTVRQKYSVRATLTPGASARQSPALRAIGARAVELVDLDGVATVGSLGWAVDPVTGVGAIPEASVEIIKDGERDYRDVATELFSRYHPADLHLRIWLGHPRLARSRWMLLDVLQVDDYVPGDAALTVLGISALALARAEIPTPIVDGELVTRTPLEYGNVTLPAAYADLLHAQIGLAERYRGAGIPSTVVHTVSKRITGGGQSGRDGDTVNGKAELDAIAQLAGGGAISSQGVVKWVDLHASGPPVEWFDQAELRPVAIAPGLRQRIPEYFVFFQWVEEEGQGRFRQEYRAFHSEATSRLGVGLIDAPRRLGDDVARWVDTQALAEEVGKRKVRTLGPGMILWRFELTYCHPELEPGDLVAVPTDQFVARDAVADRELKGNLWALGVIVRVGDVLGRSLDVWIRSYADIRPEGEVVDRSTLGPPSREIYNVRYLQELETDTHQALTADHGPGVQRLFGAALELDGDTEANWLRVINAVDELPDGVLMVPKPGLAAVTLAQLEGRYQELGGIQWQLGSAKRLKLSPPPGEVPAYEVDDAETPWNGTAWVSVQERGLAVERLEVQTQVGRNPPSAWRAWERGPGRPSAVRGGTLGAGEYEHVVARVGDLFSWIAGRAWVTGLAQPVSIGYWAFDKAQVPVIEGIDIEGQTAKPRGNSEARSWAAEKVGGGWSAELDGQSPTFLSIPVPAADTWEVEFRARNAPIAGIGPETISVMETRVVRGSSVTDFPTWAQVPLVAAPADFGLTAVITLLATTHVDLPSCTTELLAAWRALGGEWSEWQSITAMVTPAPGAPSDTAELFDFVVPGEHRRKVGSGVWLEYSIRAEIRDAGAVVDGRVGYGTWEILGGEDL